MFWKKKSKPKDSLIETTDEVRGAFRVEPLPNEPIDFQYLGKTVRVLDISAGGVSIKDDHFVEGQREKVTLPLPGDEPRELKVMLEVVRILDAKGVCCCQFVDLTNEQDDMVGEYVLERQKHDLQKKKGQS